MNCFEETITHDYALYYGDCIEVTQGIPDNSVHLTVTSIPFSNLYIYSDSVRDLGNCASDEEFFQQMEFLIEQLYRMTLPGRLCAIHCKELVDYKGRDGRAGLRDFPGDIIRAFEKHNWKYHSRVTIWKDPVIEMQRTKAHGLLHKQLCADSTFSRQGMAEYLVVFRKWAAEGEEVEPVNSGNDRSRFRRYVGLNGPEPSMSDREYSIAVWQRYASPVWMDIRQTNVLNTDLAREGHDEKHICPLQLDVIERCIELWSNAGDVVLDPFNGIGSSGVVSLQTGRRYIGIELKQSYYRQALRFLNEAAEATKQLTLIA